MIYVQIEIYLMYFWNLEILRWDFLRRLLMDIFTFNSPPFFGRKDEAKNAVNITCTQ